MVADICPGEKSEDEANASLIAAAPELLEHCKMALKDAHDALSGQWVPTPESWQCIVDGLQSVIDEAEG